MNSGRKVSAVSKSEETENPNSPATVKYVESSAWKLLLPDAPAQPPAPTSDHRPHHGGLAARWATADPQGGASSSGGSERAAATHTDGEEP